MTLTFPIRFGGCCGECTSVLFSVSVFSVSPFSIPRSSSSIFCHSIFCPIFILAPSKKAILQSEHFDFFAVSREAYSQWSHFAEARATILPDSSNQYEQYWDGPFEKISEALKLISGQPTLILAVSSPTLRTYVEAELNTRMFAALYLANSLWGLVECGIVDQHLVFDEQDEPLINPQFQVPCFPFISGTQNSNPSPETWETNLNTSISQLENQIASLTQRLTTMQLIAQKIERFGGWDKFKQSYSDKL